jgi:glycosyltransferase involved in cell wall biosynthesis
MTYRVLWINHRDPRHPSAGGAEMYLWSLISRLRAPEFAHTFLCEAAPGLAREEIIDGVRVVRRGNRWTFHLEALRWDEPRDVCIESVAHAVPFYRGRLTRDRTIVVLFHLHQRVVVTETGFLEATVVRLLEGTLRFRSAAFVAISQATREQALRDLGLNAEISVIPPGVDTAYFHPGEKKRPPQLLYLGMLKRYKRVDHVIRAFKALKTDASLLIAGIGYDDARLKSIAGPDARIRFAGHVSEDEKAELLRSASANIMASTTEGFGLTLLEAAASGTPSVAYDVGPAREGIQDGRTGALAKDGDVVDLARAISDALSHSEWGPQAREYSFGFSWENSARRLAEVIRSRVEHPAGGPEL